MQCSALDLGWRAISADSQLMRSIAAATVAAPTAPLTCHRTLAVVNASGCSWHQHRNRCHQHERHGRKIVRALLRTTPTANESSKGGAHMAPATWLLHSLPAVLDRWLVAPFTLPLIPALRSPTF